MTPTRTRVMRHIFALLLALLCASPWAPAARAQAAAQPASAADYVREPRMRGFVVAPSNRHAAFHVLGDKGRRVLAVMDLENPTAPAKVIAGYVDADITRVGWINDRRLFYEAYQSGAEIRTGGAGSFAVDLDGERPVQLVNWVHDHNSTGTRFESKVLTYGWNVWRSWDRSGDDVLVYRNEVSGANDFTSRSLGRLNSLTGKFSNLSFEQPPFTSGWTFDAKGEMRLATVTRDGRRKLYLRPSGRGEWAEIEDEALLSDRALYPQVIESDGTVIVLSRRGRDTLAMHTYDPKTRALGAEPLAAAEGFDVDDWTLDHPSGQVVGVHLQADRPRSVWFDPGLQAVQRVVDETLPRDRFNRLICGSCLGTRHFVVRSSSDRVSAEYFVYDRQLNRLTRIGIQRPWLPEASQGRRSFHRVAARDGLSLPVVVTHPPGRDDAKALPAVVLVHGGPWVRDATLEWSAEAQFLASRGWRVLEVDFRGSTGLGERHFAAGFKQWGLAMQDDLADALDWAVREKLVDPARVCIAGSDYGGYAALMGPVRHPGRYRCAASFAGVTDLTLMYSYTTTDASLQGRKYSYPQLIGDPKADAEQLRQTSPLHRVAEIKVPVLLAQGKLARGVTELHADRFEAAARAAGVDIERVTYSEEADSWIEPRNHADYLQRLERLLARTLALPR